MSMKKGHKMPPRIDLAGQRFGNYAAERYAGNSSWHCRCDCGTERIVTTSNLRRGNSLSCGCKKPEKSRIAATRHGMRDTSIYSTWLAMKQRCNNPNNTSYVNYGGRGIRICERWSSFENFLADMGEKPVGMEIERNDVNGNYEPSNCRWATLLEQANNTRRNNFVTYGGKTQTISQWARELSLSPATLYRRIEVYGMPLEKAMQTGILDRHAAAQVSADKRWGLSRPGRVRIPQKQEA
jgi:hypothetical protein